jgi:hypothetical protein
MLPNPDDAVIWRGPRWVTCSAPHDSNGVRGHQLAASAVLLAVHALSHYLHQLLELCLPLLLNSAAVAAAAAAAGGLQEECSDQAVPEGRCVG